ncbi:MAG: hypothetical protein HPY50_11070 [Firmicutes bacterium]|nr:hypothetical protein [Bacillota bacterium]
MYQQLAYNPINDLNVQASLARIMFWRENTLFTWQWWLLLAVVAVSALIWWRLVDRSRLLEIVCYGILGAVPAMVFDITGTMLGWYAYPILLQPYYPGTIFGIITPAIIGMLIYQYFPSWRGFLITVTLASAVLSFTGQPLLAYIGVYKIYNFSYLYSFLIFIIIAVWDKWTVGKMKSARTGY